MYRSWLSFMMMIMVILSLRSFSHCILCHCHYCCCCKFHPIYSNSTFLIIKDISNFSLLLLLYSNETNLSNLNKDQKLFFNQNLMMMIVEKMKESETENEKQQQNFFPTNSNDDYTMPIINEKDFSLDFVFFFLKTNPFDFKWFYCFSLSHSLTLFKTVRKWDGKKMNFKQAPWPSRLMKNKTKQKSMMMMMIITSIQCLYLIDVD